MPRFLSAGYDIAYVDEGEGPPVLLLHGFASSSRVNWVETGWVSALTRAGRRAIAMDLRGHGDSAKPMDVEAYALASLAEDAARLLDHLALSSADLMGYSLGARVAALTAIVHPPVARTLILGGMAGGILRGLDQAEAIAAGLEASGIDAVGEPTARSFRAFAERTGSDRRALAAAMRARRDVIAAADLAALKLPILVVLGTADTLAGPIDDIARLLPQAELLPIAGRNHMNTVGDRAFKAAVLSFLDRAGR
ncbi:MAG: alpha/beta hydrolase [Bauldia sp.]